MKQPNEIDIFVVDSELPKDISWSKRRTLILAKLESDYPEYVISLRAGDSNLMRYHNKILTNLRNQYQNPAAANNGNGKRHNHRGRSSIVVSKNKTTIPDKEKPLTDWLHEWVTAGMIPAWADAFSVQLGKDEETLRRYVADYRNNGYTFIKQKDGSWLVAPPKKEPDWIAPTIAKLAEAHGLINQALDELRKHLPA